MIEPSELIQLMRTANTGKVHRNLEIIHKKALEEPDNAEFYDTLVCLFRICQDPKHSLEPSKFVNENPDGTYEKSPFE